MRSRPRCWLAFGLVALSLTGCLGQRYPTQSNPTCSWDSTPPSRSAELCDTVFVSLRHLLRVTLHGNQLELSRIVAAPAVRGRIRAFGHRMRSSHGSGIHIVPSFTLNEIRPAYFGAGFYLLGSTNRGRLKSPNTLYLEIHGRRVVVVNDQPAQDL